MVLCMAQLMFGIDVTIVQVANPTIEHALRFTPQTLQWTITGYSLTYGGFLLLGGRVGDLFGRRKLFALGMVGFAAASAGGGASVDATMLILFRAGQGFFAALVSPSVLGLLAQTFPEGRGRQRAYGIWASAISTGDITGYVVGGALIPLVGWRGIFYLNIPVCLAASIMALRLFPATGTDGARRRLDVPGATTVTGGIGLIIFGLGETETKGWSSPLTLGCLVAAVLLLAAFVVFETRSAEPLLPFHLLRRRQAVANGVAVLQTTALGSGIFLNSLYLQQVFGYSPALTGLAVTPLSLAIIVATNFSSRAIGRLGPRVLSPAGLLCISAGLLWLSRVGDRGSYPATYLPALLLEGVGLGLSVVPIVNTATSNVDPDHQGLIGGMYTMSQQLGSAIGIASIVTVVSAGTAHAVAHRVAHGVAAEAVGIRLGYRVGTFVALVAATVGLLALPRRAAASALPAELESEFSIAGELGELA